MARDKPIAPVVKTDTRTLLEADFANELIQLTNKLATMEVKFVTNGSSRVVLADDKAYLTILVSDLLAAIG